MRDVEIFCWMGLICRPRPSVLALRVELVWRKQIKKWTKYPPSFASSHPKPGRASNSFACLLKWAKTAQSEGMRLSGRGGGIAGCSQRCVRHQRMAQNHKLKFLRAFLKTSNRKHFLSVVVFHRFHRQSYLFFFFLPDKELRGTRRGKSPKVQKCLLLEWSVYYMLKQWLLRDRRGCWEADSFLHVSHEATVSSQSPATTYSK